jgi:hypothetical protein
MTFAKEVVTASILNNQARFHRVRAEQFRVHAYTRRNPDSRAMYVQLAARETAIAECLERQPLTEPGRQRPDFGSGSSG